MESMPKISEAEHQVMKVVWKGHPITAMEIIKELTTIMDWKPKTIKTLINRLLKKGALGFEVSGREYSYYPLIGETDFTRAENHSFLMRVYGGAVKPMLATMVENEDLSMEDIDDLKRLLKKKKGK
jgi:BlaI family transcriptional regulator, penicillinase repressor